MQRNSLAVLIDDNVVYNDYFRLLWMYVLHHYGDFIWHSEKNQSYDRGDEVNIKAMLQLITNEVARLDITNTAHMLTLSKNYEQYKKSLLERIGLTVGEVNQENLDTIITSTIATFTGYLSVLPGGVSLTQQLMLNANKFLRKDIKDLMANDYDQCVIHNFSGRQTPHADIKAARRDGTSFYSPDLALLTDAIQQDLQQSGRTATLDKYPMRKILGGLEDVSKFALIYAYAHNMAKKAKDADRVLFIFEEDEKTRSLLFNVLSAYQTALPDCQVLIFDNVPTSYYQVVNGIGPTDENFEANLKQLIAPFADQKQKSINLARELIRTNKLAEFLDTRDLTPPGKQMCGARLFAQNQAETAKQDIRPVPAPSNRPGM